jgi:DtxR family transcriptional regulator, Mn-dependent transcriptional regulator
MIISERSQEILEHYWIENKEENRTWEMEIITNDTVAQELIEKGFAVSRGRHLKLLKKGWDEAKNCIRRHRLAECLLSDVLDVKKDKLHQHGCEFEHALHKNVERNICTLLGHPETCPHGKKIPRGLCCKKNISRPHRLVLPLTECDLNENAKIVFIKTDSSQVMNKLMAMGIHPGLTVSLIKKKPSYLFQMGESQFAVDKELAEKIQVRISD